MLNKVFFEMIYKGYNKKKYLYTKPYSIEESIKADEYHDPLEFLHQYDKKEDIEVVGLIASSLAYGRMKQIIKSVRKLLYEIEDSPSEFLKNSTDKIIMAKNRTFKHRFTSGNDIGEFFINIKSMLMNYGTIENCFMDSYEKKHGCMENALRDFSLKFNKDSQCRFLIPSPSSQGAFKRLNLFLRWMVRKDEVDIGCWTCIPKSELLVPVDTHMLRISQKLKITSICQPNFKAVKAITSKFREISPEDPVKYDFSLTRLGIIKELDLKNFLALDDKEIYV